MKSQIKLYNNSKIYSYQFFFYVEKTSRDTGFLYSGGEING